MVQFKLTTSALKSIDKFGGLDNYLLESKYVTEGKGWEYKHIILNVRKQRAAKAAAAAEAAAAGQAMNKMEE
eukprot:CAMPEP_0198138406 /NCGR_PEP_ID=MMETSP1443-20131203/1819_1 /TAXON_ID=186043 /ORGANISM="Entomoneis sp., Strain CCMP2396" /LENGTH=71 /DNA_ID=CAMNT_0043800177 /DNA_START=364 /DNA_END=579 /DNA_ORIENTATION=-